MRSCVVPLGCGEQSCRRLQVRAGTAVAPARYRCAGAGKGSAGAPGQLLELPTSGVGVTGRELRPSPLPWRSPVTDVTDTMSNLLEGLK
jgi:hypothetical protein